MEALIHILVYFFESVYDALRVGKKSKNNSEWILREEVFSLGSLFFLFLFAGEVFVLINAGGNVTELGHIALTWLAVMSLFIAMKYSMVEAPTEQVKKACGFCDYTNKKALLVYLSAIVFEATLVLRKGIDWIAVINIGSTMLLILFVFTFFLAIKHDRVKELKSKKKTEKEERIFIRNEAKKIKVERAFASSEPWVWWQELFGAMPLIIAGHFIVIGGVMVITQDIIAWFYWSSMGVFMALIWVILKKERKEYLNNFVVGGGLSKHFIGMYPIFLLIVMGATIFSINGMFSNDVLDMGHRSVTLRWLWVIILFSIYIGTRAWNINRETTENKDKNYKDSI